MAIHSSIAREIQSRPGLSAVVFFAAFVATVIWVLTVVFTPVGKRRLRDGQRSNLPPGPRGQLLFGNLLQFKSARGDPEHKLLRGLTQYGEMATLHMGSKTWVLLNSHRVVSEIIAKRGALTNGRSPMPVASGIVSRNARSLLLPPNGWTERRRVMHHLLNGAALREYGAWQELESTQMMAEYLCHPARWFRHHYRYANSVVHRIALGERLVKSTRDLEDLQDVVTTFVGSIGASIVDWFPELARLPRPLQLWRPYWERVDRWNHEIYCRWWRPVRRAIDAGTAPPSFVRDVLLHPDSKFQGSDEDAMYVALQLVEAGSDTTREVLNTFVMAAVCYPDVFRRARDEVDRVCCGTVDDVVDAKGNGNATDNGDGEILPLPLRMPRLQDMEQMPYICCIIKELLRWRPIFALTPDHCLTADFEFEGYRFPEGTGFVINEIAVSDECEDADEFRPERWLGDGHETEVAHGVWQFGGGRRICVGYRLAQRGLFINIARLAMLFEFEAAGELDSKKLNHHRTDEPFPVRVRPRGPTYESLIVEDAKREGVLEAAQEKH